MATRTADLQAAIEAQLGGGKTILLRDGTYEISGALWCKIAGAFKHGLRLRGESRDGTIIKLVDGSVGATPMAMLTTYSQWDGVRPNDGSGNQAFRNTAQDVTFDIGSGNPGAAAIDWIGSNFSALRNLRIRSGDGQGRAGLLLTRPWPGPLLMGGLIIERFDFAVDIGQVEYGVTVDNLNASGQRVAAIRNTGNQITVSRLVSVNSVPALLNLSSSGNNRDAMLTILDSTLTGGSAGRSAIESVGMVYAKNVVTSGYDSALKQDGIIVPGNTLGEYSTQARSDAGAINASLDVPFKRPGRYHDNNLANWQDGLAGRSNTTPERDDAGTINANIALGKPSVFLALGVRAGGTIGLPPSLNHLLITAGSVDVTTGSTYFADAANPKPMFKITGDSSEPLTIEGLMASNSNNPNAAGLIWFENASSRPVIFRDIGHFYRCQAFYTNNPGCGDLFLENVGVTAPMKFPYPQDVYGVQFNPENHSGVYPEGQPLIQKTGGLLYVIGLKTEDEDTVAQLSGGTAIIYGGFFKPVKDPGSTPVFALSNAAKVKAVYLTHKGSTSVNDYSVHVVDGGETLLASALPRLNTHTVNVWYSAAAAPRALGGTGLVSQYFTGGYYGDGFTTPIGAARTEAQVNVDLGQSNPPTGTPWVAKDRQSVERNGYLLCPVTGSYTFGMVNDRYSKYSVTINGATVASGTPTSETPKVAVSMMAGQRYPIRVRYEHDNNNIVERLSWSLNGSVQQIVPASALWLAAT